MNNLHVPFLDGVVQLAVMLLVLSIALDFIFSFATKKKFPVTKWMAKAIPVGFLQFCRGVAWVAENLGDWLTTSAPSGPGAGRRIGAGLMYIVGFPLLGAGALARVVITPALKALKAKPKSAAPHP